MRPNYRRCQMLVESQPEPPKFRSASTGIADSASATRAGTTLTRLLRRSLSTAIRGVRLTIRSWQCPFDMTRLSPKSARLVPQKSIILASPAETHMIGGLDLGHIPLIRGTSFRLSKRKGCCVLDVLWTRQYLKEFYQSTMPHPYMGGFLKALATPVLAAR
ncbi:hypothetical protein BD310DRAFT_908706 [Dichomitus squalens]|uniref:Uncharacterized protein n=1 Tax=Dichomitus squalens TaxID=114155 RepID=A0A4Q9PKS3_9APHY|nr:hypothetical protein BD310DRAFT_908706 [Dichomitus squalens]